MSRLRFEGTDDYVATEDLKVAVNAAIALERPLLIKGEPGTGKTVLAEQIAKALGSELITWHIKSTTKATMGLYKADIEFPNDLLQELDRMEFYVYETNETIKAAVRPIVIITSNNEKELPDAFLRRCFFHYIRFPDAETMQEIVDVHYPGIKNKLVAEALRIFYDMRKVPGLKKKPSTSELLDWLKLLMVEDIDGDMLAEEDPPKLIPPLHGALLKNEQDVHLFERLAFLARREGAARPGQQ